MEGHELRYKWGRPEQTVVVLAKRGFDTFAKDFGARKTPREKSA